MNRRIAGIDVHKRVLMVAVGMATTRMIVTEGESESQETIRFEMRRFGTTLAELQHLASWLQEHPVTEAVMESTAQYCKPVWLGLEPHLRLQLAQAGATVHRRVRRQTSRMPNGWCGDIWPEN